MLLVWLFFLAGGVKLCNLIDNDRSYLLVRFWKVGGLALFNVLKSIVFKGIIVFKQPFLTPSLGWKGLSVCPYICL